MALDPIVRFVPLSIAILLPITFTVSFYMARTAKHITGFNYISDTGTVPPESCYFGQLLNIIALLMAYACYHMYLLVDKTDRLERIALYVGLISAFGTSLVANFQELYVLPIHLIGAFLAFGGSTVYFWLRSVASEHLKMFRMVISTIATVSFITCFVAGSISLSLYRNEMKDLVNWKSSFPGYKYHATSVLAEWITGTTVLLYMITHYIEMSSKLLDPVLPS